MTQHKQLRDNYIAVQVPDEAINVKVEKVGKYFHLSWDYPRGHNYTGGGISLMYNGFGGKKKYPTDLTFLFLTSTATEEDCRKVVEGKPMFYKNYKNGNAVFTATESFDSMKQSVGITEGVWAVLEKK